MQIKSIFLSMLFGQVVICGQAQFAKSTNHVNQIWVAYFNQTRFDEKWGLWADIQLRTKEEFVNNLSQSVARVGLTHYLNDNTKLSFGYAFFNHFPADNHANISQPEHRIWQQVQWHSRYPRLRLMQWIRLEERFRHKIANNDYLAEGYNYNWKLRYNISFSVPLSKRAFQSHTFSLVLNDEVHVNFGKEIVYNYFDQHRIFAGVTYHANAHDNLQLGYMNLFQQLASGNNYKNIHAARISYFHNVDLRKK